jgi:hypothetical protein
MLCFGFHAAGLAALDQEIVLGREDGWRDFPSLENLVRRPGKWDTLDFFLREDEYPVAGRTDLLVHFDREGEGEATGNYRLDRGRASLSPEVRVLGEAAAGFNGERAGVRLAPQPGALLARGTLWEDFSIEFWLRPSQASDGEEVLSWSGSRWREGRLKPQELRCLVRSRRLIWEFVNFFGGQQEAQTSIRLEGISPLVPRSWHHHLLRFDSASGLLEYLVDGVPEAVAYARAGPEGPPLEPYTGEADSAPLLVGRGYTGFLDELRISRSFVEHPVLTRYDGRAGVAVSAPLDLGYTGTRLKRVEAVYEAKGDSDVFFYYRLADRLTSDQLESDWVQFRPGDELPRALGRYAQLRVELFPDGRRSLSPQLSELRLVYEQDLPPAPPAGVLATAGDGLVRLRWKPVREEDVRGYLVYYGQAPGTYHGTDADRGPSPIDTGAATELELEGLENGRLYYFAVVCYDSTVPPHRSAFSKEVSARPSGALR